MHRHSTERFCGRIFSGDEITEIKEIISTCNGISRTELANTICELFDWKRPSGRLKGVECRQFLEYLDSKGILDLPDRKGGRPKGAKSKVKRTGNGEAPEIITGEVKSFLPLILCSVTTKEQRDLWYEYVDRYHYLGFQLPFGAQLRYFIESPDRGEILGCLQFSSPVWKMAPRDRWIGWNDAWVRIKNLASSVLAVVSRVVGADWESRYGYHPVLLETLVDKKRFKGTCYKGANWVYVGTTTGRGRMDRHRTRQGRSPKDIYLYPLTARFREELLGL